MPDDNNNSLGDEEQQDFQAVPDEESQSVTAPIPETPTSPMPQVEDTTEDLTENSAEDTSEGVPEDASENMTEEAAGTPYESAYKPVYDNATSSVSHAANYAPTYDSYEQPKKRGGGGRTFLLAFLGALVACVIAFCVLGAMGWIGPHDSGTSSDSATSTTLGSDSDNPIVVESEDSTLAEAVAAKALPSVVSIYVYTSESSSYDYYGFGFGYGYGDDTDSNALTQSSLGSGVVLTEDGYIITNYHVIEGAEALKVSIEGEEFDAEVVGSDTSSDIAVVKAEDASGLTPIEIGDSDELIIGEWVMSIGCPFGLEQSVATGIVSATSRSQVLSDSTSGETTIYPNMIQTDAAINPGNSGGALVDAEGKLIGINTLITSYSGNYSGVGFAIPVNYAINLAQQIIDGESPTHAQLGVSLTTIDASTASRYGFSVDSGAYVSAVTAGSSAEAAGIEIGDIIVRFDGQKVESATDLMLDVRTKNPGDTATVTVNRDGETIDFDVTLGSDEQQVTEEEEAESETQDEEYESILDWLRNYGYDYGGNSNNNNAF